MPNLKAKIDGHNKKILETTLSPKTKLCNCLKKENFLMRGACPTENILYHARISCDNKTYQPKLYKSEKLLLKNVMQIIKSLSVLKRTILETGK